MLKSNVYLCVDVHICGQHSHIILGDWGAMDDEIELVEDGKPTCIVVHHRKVMSSVYITLLTQGKGKFRIQLVIT